MSIGFEVLDSEKGIREMQGENQVGEKGREMKLENRWSTIDGATVTLVDEPYKAEITFYDLHELHYLTVYVLEDGDFVRVKSKDFEPLAVWTGHLSRAEAIQAFKTYVTEQRANSCS